MDNPGMWITQEAAAAFVEPEDEPEDDEPEDDEPEEDEDDDELEPAGVLDVDAGVLVEVDDESDLLSDLPSVDAAGEELSLPARESLR